MGQIVSPVIGQDEDELVPQSLKLSDDEPDVVDELVIPGAVVSGLEFWVVGVVS